MIALLIIVNLLSMLICYQIAKSRQADRWYWLLDGLRSCKHIVSKQATDID
jgi:hypothetical protein